jgi:hypothetical protein
MTSFKALLWSGYGRGRALSHLMTLATVAAAAAGLTVAQGTASAQQDAANQVIDYSGDTVEALMSDTQITFVPPLDGNPMSREWFHSGTAGFKITGPKAKDWSGIVTVGYQVGYPATLSGQLHFNWSTPQLGVACFPPTCGPLVNNLLPTVGVDVGVGFGPGIQNVTLATGPVKGSQGTVKLSALHASVTGVIGPTHIRPYVMVTSSDGTTVVAYGNTWTD